MPRLQFMPEAARKFLHEHIVPLINWNIKFKVPNRHDFARPMPVVAPIAAAET